MGSHALLDTAANTDAWNMIGESDLRVASPQVAMPERIEWTTKPGYGPGTEVLGDLSGTTVAEIGCGTGDNLAVIAAAGARHALGVDIASNRVAAARLRWGHLPAMEFRTGEAAAVLAETGPLLDIICSVFGALWYSDPELLLPAIAARQRPGGRLVFSAGSPPPEGPNGRRVDYYITDDATRMPVVYYAYAIQTWGRILNSHGYAVVDSWELEPPGAARSQVIVSALRRG